MIQQVLALLLTIGAGNVQAQVQELWTVEQPEYEAGWAWPDLNNDGVQELIKEDGLNCIFYDGADEYSVVWIVTDPASSDNSSFTMWHFESGAYVFLHQDLELQTSRIHVYAGLGLSPVWSSPLQQGNVSTIAIGDLDNNSALEIAWSWHRQEGELWSSAWKVCLLVSGLSLHEEEPAAGYLQGPYFANIEGDAADELLFNWYLTDGSASLSCWGDQEVSVAPAVERPEEFGMKSWPNPFNPLCRIELERVPADIRELSIHSIDGRLMRTLPVSPRANGNVSLIWDGLNRHGRQAPSGTYLLKAGDRTSKITLLR